MQDYRAEAIRQAERAGVDPQLFARLINQESGWNPTAKSPVGAYGLTQAMPATAAKPGFGVAPLTDVNDPTEQLRFGADYLDAMLDRYDGDVPRALAAYNWGAGNADKWGGEMSSLPDETRGYISNITGKKSAGLSRAGISSKENSMADRAAMNSAAPKQDEYKPAKVAAGLHADLNESLGSDRRSAMGDALHGIGLSILDGGF